jgi:hypothetical protein
MTRFVTLRLTILIFFGGTPSREILKDRDELRTVTGQTANRRWLRAQFRLRTALCAMTAISVALAVYVSSYRQQERCIRRLRELGVNVSFDYQWTTAGAYRPSAKPPGNDILKRVLGEHYASNPRDVLVGERFVPRGDFTDADAALVASLRELRWLSLQGSKVTDQGLLQLTGLSKLERLDLEGSRVTRNGVRRIKAALPKVRVYSDYPEVDDESTPSADTLDH